MLWASWFTLRHAQGESGSRRRLQAQPRKLLATYSYQNTVPFSYIDWSEQDMVTPVKDQGQVCTACCLRRTPPRLLTATLCMYGYACMKICMHVCMCGWTELHVQQIQPSCPYEGIATGAVWQLLGLLWGLNDGVRLHDPERPACHGSGRAGLCGVCRTRQLT